jgi:hypothetical protein
LRGFLGTGQQSARRLDPPTEPLLLELAPLRRERPLAVLSCLGGPDNLQWVTTAPPTPQEREMPGRVEEGSSIGCSVASGLPSTLPAPSRPDMAHPAGALSQEWEWGPGP